MGASSFLIFPDLPGSGRYIRVNSARPKSAAEFNDVIRFDVAYGRAGRRRVRPAFEMNAANCNLCYLYRLRFRTIEEPAMSNYVFDDGNITWNRLGDFEHLHYSILAVDEEKNIAEVLFKFAANERIVLHRHKAHNNTFVVQGEHRLYKPDGSLKEVVSFPVKWTTQK